LSLVCFYIFPNNNVQAQIMCVWFTSSHLAYMLH